MNPNYNASIIEVINAKIANIKLITELRKKESSYYHWQTYVDLDGRKSIHREVKNNNDQTWRELKQIENQIKSIPSLYNQFGYLAWHKGQSIYIHDLEAQISNSLPKCRALLKKYSKV